jgi:hypothetical protein
MKNYFRLYWTASFQPAPGNATAALTKRKTFTNNFPAVLNYNEYQSKLPQKNQLYLSNRIFLQ